MANRLADETSPYLLQHKDNPVDWWPWCDEAFAEARRPRGPGARVRWLGHLRFVPDHMATRGQRR
jgi:hypothetical protein